MEGMIPALQRFFPNLLRMSLSGGILTAVVLLLRLILRRAPKWILCLLWLLVAVRLVIPEVRESRASLMPQGDTAVRLTASLDASLPELEWESPEDRTVNRGDGENGRVSSAASPGQYLPLVWLSGTVAMLLWALVSFLRLRRRTAASLGMEGNVYLCDGIASPFILGVFRPRIYLPSGLEGPGLASVLAHERAHLRRGDQVWKLLGFLLLALHWFNPLLWLAYLLFCRDVELACDEQAVRDMSPQDRADYSQALLDLSRPGRGPAICPLAFGEVGVKRRVKSVLNYRKPGIWLILFAVLVCLLAAVLFLTDPVPLLPEGTKIAYASCYDETGSFTLEPEAGEELAKLVRSYGKRRYYAGNRSWGGYEDAVVYLRDGQDNTIMVEYRYVSRSSWWTGEKSGFEAVVYSFSTNRYWRMEERFNAAFLDWKRRWVLSPEERDSMFYRMTELLYLAEGLEEAGPDGGFLFLPGAYVEGYSAENWPEYCVTPEGRLLIREADSQKWEGVGMLREFTPDAGNFDRYYRDALRGVPDLHGDTQKVWRLISKVNSVDGTRPGCVFYDLILTESGTCLACGYYDEGEAGDPYSDDSRVYWLVRLTPEAR